MLDKTKLLWRVILSIGHLKLFTNHLWGKAIGSFHRDKYKMWSLEKGMANHFSIPALRIP